MEKEIKDNNKIKLYLLTGFLGSGKTSLLLAILKKLKDKKVAVIMNEFGKTGIDGEIISKDVVELEEINRGSIFCSCLELNFVKALIDMSKKDLDYVIVESSGLADPSNIGKFLEAVRVNIGDRYQYSGAITLIDGRNFIKEVEDIETVERQLKFSHLALISKIDLINDEEKAKVIERVKEINPKVIIGESHMGETNIDFLNMDLIRDGWLGIEETTNTPENKPKTLTLSFDESVDEEKLLSFIKDIIPLSYRMKGFINIEGKFKQVDVVTDKVDIKDSDLRNEGRSELVIISKVGNNIIRPIFNSFEEKVGIEMKLR